MTGVHARYVKTVGEVNFYKEYEVAVQAFNDLGDGPMSPIAVIRSAMKSTLTLNAHSQWVIECIYDWNVTNEWIPFTLSDGQHQQTSDVVIQITKHNWSMWTKDNSDTCLKNEE